MRVALVSPFNALVPGGISRYVEGLGEALAACGCAVEIVSPGPQPDGPKTVGRRTIDGRGRTVQACSVLRSLARFHPDVVHVHGPWYHLAGAVAFRLLARRSRLVATRHTLPNARFGPAKRLVESALLARCDALAVPSAATAEALEAVADVPVRVPVHVVGAGVTVPEELRDGAAALSSPPHLGTIAVLVYPEKVRGVQDLVAALPDLGAADGGPVLTVVGADALGTIPDELRAAAAAAGVAGRVTFTGALDDPWSVLDGIDLYVHPSRRESLSLAVLEAMARGLPVVATDVGGTREAIRHGIDGLLIPPGDIGAMSAAIRAMLGDASLRGRLGASARRRVIERFGWRRLAERHLGIYRGPASAGR